MIKPRLIFLALVLGLAALSSPTQAQQQPELEIESLTGQVEYDFDTGVAVATNGVIVKYGSTVLTADRVTVNEPTGEALAEGRVRIQREDQVWAGENIRYNFKTRQMETAQFRTGKSPVFAEGEELQGDSSNQVYIARNAYITTDDVATPFQRVRARQITIIPGKSIEARHAFLYLGKVPVFYFPYYKRNLDAKANHFNFTPGYRSTYGPFLLGSYTWFLNDQVDGVLHGDYREKRGFGGGADVNLHLKRWGETSLNYYYMYDRDPGLDDNGDTIPNNRSHGEFAYNATPFTNLTVKSQVRYQSDPLILHDFFESLYRLNPQPNTYVEVNRVWDNYSLDLVAQPRINDFFQNVAQLPDVKFTWFPQQVGQSPVYYQSVSSAGYFRQLYAVTNGVTSGDDYSAARGDTFHQLTLPQTYFGWLNVTPRVGGRLDYYSASTGPGGTNGAAGRGIFNTGAEVSFKASQLWAGATNGWLDLDGVRHIVEPSVNYVYIPQFANGPNQVPQFDTQLPSLRLLPIDFPDYNDIDSIDHQNVMRFKVGNLLQTKREGEVVNFLNWDLYTDWYLQKNTYQTTTFSDAYSDLTFRPRTWLTFESLLRYEIDGGVFRMSYNTLTISPNNTWSWSFGHYYLLADNSPSPTAVGPGNNLFTSVFYYRLNENWGLRMAHQYSQLNHLLQNQQYSIYRDLRSWTAALTFRVLQETGSDPDYTVAFTFSLKAAPKFGVGGDAIRGARLLGY